MKEKLWLVKVTWGGSKLATTSYGPFIIRMDAERLAAEIGLRTCTLVPNAKKIEVVES